MSPHTTFEDAEEIRICHGDIDYRGIIEHINDGVVIIREGRIVFANNAFYEMVQKTRDQVIASDFLDFISPADREEVARYCTERLFTAGLRDRIEFAASKEDGEAIIEMKVSVVECGGTPAILGALTDITERRKTRLELQHIKERLESILHSMNDVVVSLRPNDYSVVAINPAAEALYGVPLRDFASGERHIMGFIHPHDKEKVNRYYQNLPEAEFDDLQYRIISNNNKVKWVLDEGRVVYSDKGTIRRIDHVIRDITDEKKAIDGLKQSEAKYRDFFESTTDMAYSVTPDGAFLDINDAGMKLLGFESKKEALASNLKNFYVDMSERARFLAEINEQGRIEEMQLKFKNKAGDIIEVSVTARAKTDDSGYLLYYEGIAHNITKAMEDQRNRVLRNAAGGMCHYLNTHLMHLHNSNGAIREELESLDALIERLAGNGNPHEVANQMKRVMGEIRHFSKGIGVAYEKISEVTKAFNRACSYKEEPYMTSTILDIFRAHGYQEED